MEGGYLTLDDLALTIHYRNWRGETALRRIVPRSVWWGNTEWHPRPQWLMTAYDLDKGAERDFALADMDIAAVPALIEALQAAAKEAGE